MQYFTSFIFAEERLQCPHHCIYVHINWSWQKSATNEKKLHVRVSQVCQWTSWWGRVAMLMRMGSPVISSTTNYFALWIIVLDSSAKWVLHHVTCLTFPSSCRPHCYCAPLQWNHLHRKGEWQVTNYIHVVWIYMNWFTSRAGNENKMQE